MCYVLPMGCFRRNKLADTGYQQAQEDGDHHDQATAEGLGGQGTEEHFQLYGHQLKAVEQDEQQQGHQDAEGSPQAREPVDTHGQTAHYPLGKSIILYRLLCCLAEKLS